MKPFKLTIPEPCHENWNEMSAKEKGRHCIACDKTVVDFTHKTPTEISRYLENSTGKVCGRFNTKDLNVTHEPNPNNKKTKRWLTWLSVFAFVGFGNKTKAQLATNYTNVEKNEPDQLHVKSGHTWIKGQVKHSDTKTGITEVEIKVYSGGKVIAYTRTFANGNYFINLPEGTVFDMKVDIEYNAVNYVSTLLKEVPINKNEIALEVIMREDSKEDAAVPAMATIDMLQDAARFDVRVEQSLGMIVSIKEPIDQPTLIAKYRIIDDTKATYPEDKLMGAVKKLEDAKYNEVKTATTSIDNHLMGAVVAVCNAPGHFIAELKKEPDSIVDSVLVTPTIQLQAYPNPTTDHFIFEVQNATQISVQLLDINGRMVQYFSSQESKHIVDLTFQPNGTYILRVIDDATNKSAEQKIIKTY